MEGTARRSSPHLWEITLMEVACRQRDPDSKKDKDLGEEIISLPTTLLVYLETSANRSCPISISHHQQVHTMLNITSVMLKRKWRTLCRTGALLRKIHVLTTPRKTLYCGCHMLVSWRAWKCKTTCVLLCAPNASKRMDLVLSWGPSSIHSHLLEIKAKKRNQNLNYLTFLGLMIPTAACKSSLWTKIPSLVP